MAQKRLKTQFLTVLGPFLARNNKIDNRQILKFRKSIGDTTPGHPHYIPDLYLFSSNIEFFVRKRFPGGWFYSVGVIFGFIFDLALTVVEILTKN